MPMATPESELTTCGLCGFRYAESAHSGCAGCPLNDGCLLTCCPNCGYSAPEPGASKLLAVGRRIKRGTRRRVSAR